MSAADPRGYPSGADGEPPDERHPLWVALWLLHADAPGEIMGVPESWPRWAVLLPHVLAATARLDPDAAGDTTVLDDASWLLDRAGTYLQVHARLNEARPLLERALAITEAAHPPDHPIVAARLNNLGLALQALGRPQEALLLFERALAIDEAAHGPNHPHVATYLGNLGLVLQDERALAIDKAAYGPDHPTVALRQRNLAGILQDLGQPLDGA